MRTDYLDIDSQTEIQKFCFVVNKKYEGSRIDWFLAVNLDDVSRNRIIRLIKDGRVYLNKKKCIKPKTLLYKEDEVEIYLPPSRKKNIIPGPEDIKIDILFEDSYLAVINKPTGMVVHPAPGNQKGTVVNALLSRYNELYEEVYTTAECTGEDDFALRPGIVHRLDKETSGCLLIAKTREAKEKLVKMFADRKIRKIYTAVCIADLPSGSSGEIETLIGRHPVNRKKMAVVKKNGKPALTRYKVIRTGMLDRVKLCLLEINLLTGRTHQIRVHCAYKKMPIAGDTTYGGKQKIKFCRLMLHAHELKFFHPYNGELISVSCPIPDKMQEIIIRSGMMPIENSHKTKYEK